MGSWHEDVLANDTALDAVAEYDRRLEMVYDGKLAVSKLVRIVIARSRGDAQPVLGIVQHLWNLGVDVRKALPLIRPIVQEELKEEHLSDWRSPKRRRKALLKFLKTVASKPHSKPEETQSKTKANPPPFDEVYRFSLNRAPARKGRLWGLIDKSSQWILPPTYDHIVGFIEDLKGVSRFTIHKKEGWIDTEGKVIIAPRFHMVLDGFRKGTVEILAGKKRERRKKVRGLWASVVIGRPPRRRQGYIDQTGRFYERPLTKEQKWFLQH